MYTADIDLAFTVQLQRLNNLFAALLSGTVTGLLIKWILV